MFSPNQIAFTDRYSDPLTDSCCTIKGFIGLYGRLTQIKEQMEESDLEQLQRVLVAALIKSPRH